MSASTDALAAGLALQIEEHGQSFEVDTEPGPIIGLIEDSTDVLGASIAGMEAGGEITVTIPRASWTPFQKATVSFDGESYTVERINGKIPHKWTFSAVLRQ